MGSERPLLYRKSHGEAARRDELRLWQESFRENVRCARAIEKAIRDGRDGEQILPDCARGVLEEYGLKRTMYVLANTVRDLGKAIGTDAAIEQWSRSVYSCPNTIATAFL